MEFWFSERHTDNVELSIRVEKQLFSGQSDFQRIDVFDSVEFGRFLTSDGNVIFSEKDEFTYDEMIVHVPMAVHPKMEHVRRSQPSRLSVTAQTMSTIDSRQTSMQTPFLLTARRYIWTTESHWYICQWN